jgi:membrane protein YqaA with SNARE-associated domain
LLKFYANHLDKIKKWGAVFIILAALFPLPYATVCTLAGILKYPVSRLTFIGLFRIARFFIYAPIVIGVT